MLFYTGYLDFRQSFWRVLLRNSRLPDLGPEAFSSRIGRQQPIAMEAVARRFAALQGLARPPASRATGNRIAIMGAVKTDFEEG
jgi:hypothetical protein